jgi:hypothetical protein
VLVVDNGSSDGSVEMARELGADVLPLPANEGFAGAINRGIQASTTDWILLLNNDVELEPSWLQSVLAAAEETGALFVTGKLLQASAPERIDGTWDLLSRAGCAWRCGFDAPDGSLWNQRRMIQFGSFTALLVHRTVFQRVGMLDTRYESYYEDVDFGLRMALAGVSGVYEPRASATHQGSATLGQGAATTYLISRNQVLLAAKFQFHRTFPLRVFWGQALFLASRVKQRSLVAALRGKWHGLRLARKYSSEAVDPAALRRIVMESEREIKDYQSHLGFDLTWRLYFAF